MPVIHRGRTTYRRVGALAGWKKREATAPSRMTAAGARTESALAALNPARNASGSADPANSLTWWPAACGRCATIRFSMAAPMAAEPRTAPIRRVVF